jgi:intracellular sulfur oxidation DsrE/DsrF family protein
MQRQPRRLLSLAVLGLAFALPFSATLLLTRAESAGKPEPKPVPVTHRLVLPINTDNPVTMKALISTAIHLGKYYRALDEGFSLEIVAYNAGLHMLRTDTSPVQELLRAVRAANPDVRFVICEATRLSMESIEGRPLSFVDGTASVPNGPARIIALQETGWSYIRS